jgi:hypothetical protein
MNAPGNTARILVLVSASSWLAGCWDDDPCDPGQIFEDTVCKPAPAPPPQEGEGGSPATDPEPQESPWGAACTTDADCAGDASFCPPSPFNTCTNIYCGAGEENEGICPADWVCLPAGGGIPTSVCLPPM